MITIHTLCHRWDYHSGDIGNAYSAEVLGHHNPNRITPVKTFLHEGKRYTQCGGSQGHYHLPRYHAYELLPRGSRKPFKRQYSYEGMLVKHDGHVFILGPKVKFVGTRSPDGWIFLLRTTYIDGRGGHRTDTYHNFLRQLIDDHDDYRFDPGLLKAARVELVQRGLPKTPGAMKKRLLHVIDPDTVQTSIPGGKVRAPKIKPLQRLPTLWDNL